MYKNIDKYIYFHQKINLERPTQYDVPHFNHRLTVTKQLIYTYISSYTKLFIYLIQFKLLSPFPNI